MTGKGPSLPCLPSLGEHCGRCHRCTPPPPTDYDYECCASGSCEVCRGFQGFVQSLTKDQT